MARQPRPRGDAALAAELRQYRETMGVNQIDLAARLGRSQETLSNWEAARYRIPDGFADAYRQAVTGIYLERSANAQRALADQTLTGGPAK